MTQEFHDQYKLRGTIYRLHTDGCSLTHVNTLYEGYNDNQRWEYQTHKSGAMWNIVCHSIEEINAALQEFWQNRASERHMLRIFTNVPFQKNERCVIVDKRIVYPGIKEIPLQVPQQLKLAI